MAAEGAQEAAAPAPSRRAAGRPRKAAATAGPVEDAVPQDGAPAIAPPPSLAPAMEPAAEPQPEPQSGPEPEADASPRRGWWQRTFGE